MRPAAGATTPDQPRAAAPAPRGQAPAGLENPGVATDAPRNQTG
jgi:hypothetical protein